MMASTGDLLTSVQTRPLVILGATSVLVFSVRPMALHCPVRSSSSPPHDTRNAKLAMANSLMNECMFVDPKIFILCADSGQFLTLSHRKVKVQTR